MKFPAESARRLPLLASLAGTLALAGCGIGTVTTATSGTSGSFAITGSVHGGMQPVTGATIQLFAAGSGGNGSQATSLLANSVITDSHGNFSLAGDSSCPTSATQIYLVARGGNPGLPGSATNPALVLLSAFGDCGNLNSSATVQINEVTTAAAGYALAQFTAGYDHIGASASNAVGLRNAFLDARLLADPGTGLAPQLPANLATESGKLYALADALASCVNSDGGSGCTPLFSAAIPTGGASPTDTLGALLNIVRNPGRNVAAVFRAGSSTPPFATTLTAPPKDWTMSLAITGGGIAEPTSIGLDSQGNVWLANFGGNTASAAGLIGYTAQGAPMAGSPFGAGLQTESYGLAVDKNDDVWVASAENLQANGTGSVAKFGGASSSTPGALVHQYTDASLNWPESVAADPNGSGTILAANYHAGTVTAFRLDGTVSVVLGANLADSYRAAFPIAVTSDNAGGAWTADQGDNNITHLLANGTVVKSLCCVESNSVHLDPGGNVWITNFDSSGDPAVFTFSEVAPDGTVAIEKQTGGGIYSPGGAVVDAGGQFWVLDYNPIPGQTFGGFSEFAGNSASVSAGTPLSPASGFGLDAHLKQPYAAAVDASGNLWMAVRTGNSVAMIFGVATPTAMPATPIPRAP